jgi:hypothetical protein
MVLLKKREGSSSSSRKSCSWLIPQTVPCNDLLLTLLPHLRVELVFSHAVHKKQMTLPHSYPNAMTYNVAALVIAGAVVIAGKFLSDLSEGIIPPPPTQARAYGMDSKAAPSPPDNVDLDATSPPASTEDNFPPLTTSTTCRPPEDKEGTHQANHNKRDDGRKEEKREEGKDEEAPHPPGMVAAIMMTTPQLHKDGLLCCSKGTATRRRNGRKVRTTKLHVHQI